VARPDVASRRMYVGSDTPVPAALWTLFMIMALLILKKERVCMRVGEKRGILNSFIPFQFD
jgi:hypothetical protein